MVDGGGKEISDRITGGKLGVGLFIIVAGEKQATNNSLGDQVTKKHLYIIQST